MSIGQPAHNITFIHVQTYELRTNKFDQVRTNIIPTESKLQIEHTVTDTQVPVTGC